MSVRSIASCLLTAAVALLPTLACAQQTAEETMRSIAARAHFHIRQAELCKQPDDATRQAKSSKILAWVNEEAARAGVAQPALSDAAADGPSQAESRLGDRPTADECAAGAQQFTTFLADTITRRKATQTVLLGRNTRAHFQMRTAQLCKQPDEAKQQQIASALTDWLTAAAAEAGVSQEALAKNAAEATRDADATFARDASPKRCQQNAASLITLSGG